MANLLSYIEASKTKQTELAAAIGISRGYLSELVGGTKRPSLDLAFAIERATGGAVPVASWNPDPAPQEAAPQPPTEDAA